MHFSKCYLYYSFHCFSFCIQRCWCASSESELHSCRACVLARQTLRYTSSRSTCVLFSALCSLLTQLIISNGHGHTLQKGSTFRDYCCMLSEEAWLLDEHRTPRAKGHSKHASMFLYARLIKSKKGLFFANNKWSHIQFSHTHAVKLWPINLENKQGRAELPRTNTHTPAAYTVLAILIDTLAMCTSKHWNFTECASALQ